MSNLVRSTVQASTLFRKRRQKQAKTAESDQRYAPFLAALIERERPVLPAPSSPPRAGDVVVTRTNGTVSRSAPYSAAQLAAVTKERVPLAAAERRCILKRDGYRCRYCGRRKGPFHIDHVLPVILGGTNDWTNLVTACQRCNLKKGMEIWQPN